MDLLHQLAEAARDGQAHRIHSLVAEGADPNGIIPAPKERGPVGNGATPLMIAAGSPQSNVETVSALLECGAEACWMAADGRSPLSEACRVGDPARVDLLIRKGATVVPDPEWGDIKPHNEHYEIPLFLAAASGCAECVRLLLDAGFPADFEDDEDRNALHFAATAEIVELLWAAEVVPVEDDWHQDPLNAAIEDGRLEAAECLLGRMRPEPDDPGFLYWRLVFGAGVMRSTDAVRMLLRHGAPVHGYVLRSACRQGKGKDRRPDAEVRDTLTLLIDAGADVDFRNDDGSTALHIAVSREGSSPTAVEVLLAHGAEVDPVDEKNETPLSLAAAHGEAECVRLLLTAGADPVRARSNARRNLETWESVDQARRRSASRSLHNEKALEDARAVVRLLDAL